MTSASGLDCDCNAAKCTCEKKCACKPSDDKTSVTSGLNDKASASKSSSFREVGLDQEMPAQQNDKVQGDMKFASLSDADVHTTPEPEVMHFDGGALDFSSGEE